ncbi:MULTISPECIES: GNAT family N-acetyltransferase [Bacillales]|jgi:DNA-3-methyladenine glycosylase I|uniref:Acetyltransferase n=1 Tax=Brevibacillus aydinogluensis TaxID=927786 RepID=A0AA48M8I5_9BACL|nr:MULTISPECIES: GNAT family N-acetyltransferase [Bacillales]REK65165.1 MAG: GNAT family N-acetyltransferase [Brevibacillus sp.]MBR8658710.1 GNAT family N-acetyltransferase [Brevibacillus sp. NL20B1]MDT3416030.1 DNA-3-methyladenine glycosylase I [Brevibacillus aydinogluensis]NNV03049.1 GNAT family N-acetyltransferase [Brevibacillus sp. MCWH]UFJ61577.1 GNAT family N-acetyltransferase [Anoxybacillus sediminis]
MNEIRVRALVESDRLWLGGFLREHWGSSNMVYGHGLQVFACDELPGFAAFCGEELVGLVTYAVADGQLQVVSLDSVREGIGVGTSLMLAVERVARDSGMDRVWLLTTNDNLNALRFYQKRGYVLVAVHRNAVEQARRLKPQIPTVGSDGIPLRDEIELEKRLSP